MAPEGRFRGQEEHMIITTHTQDIGADSGQLSVQIHGIGSMDRIHGPDPWIWSMDLIHGSDPWIRSMEQIHGSDPWICSMDQMKRNRKHKRWPESAPISGEWLEIIIYSSWLRKRPSGAIVVRNWLPSYAVAQFGQCCACSIRRLEMHFRVLFSIRILIKSMKNDEFHDLWELGPF